MLGLVRAARAMRPVRNSGLVTSGRQQRWHSGHTPWSEVKNKTDFASYCECQKAAIVLGSWLVIGLGTRALMKRGKSTPSASEEPPSPGAASEPAAL